LSGSNEQASGSAGGRDYELIIQYLNDLEGCDGFISQNYAPSKTHYLEKPRMYFTDENAKKIDAIRIKIEEWKNKDLLNENEYYILLATLIEAIGFFSIFWVYMEHLKKIGMQGL